MRYLNILMPLLILDFMQVHLTFISLSLTYILIFCTWSPRGEWPLSSLGNSLLLRSKFIPIHKWRVYFLQPSHHSIPLKSGQGLAQVLDSTSLAHYKVEARYVSLQVLIFFFSFPYMIMHAGLLCIYVCVLYSITIILTCMAFIDMTHTHTHTHTHTYINIRNFY